MTEDKQGEKPRAFAIPSHSTSSEYQELYQAYAALAKENEELKVKLADFELDCKMSDDVIDHTEKEITSLRESLKLAVDALEWISINSYKQPHNAQKIATEALTKINAKGEL